MWLASVYAVQKPSIFQKQVKAHNNSVDLLHVGMRQLKVSKK